MIKRGELLTLQLSFSLDNATPFENILLMQPPQMIVPKSTITSITVLQTVQKENSIANSDSDGIC